MLGLAAPDPRYRCRWPLIVNRITVPPTGGSVPPTSSSVPRICRDLTDVVGRVYDSRAAPDKHRLIGRNNRMNDNLHLRFLDGPRFTRWLVEEEKFDPAVLGDSQRRRWYDWERGARADLYSNSVDRILTDQLISSRLIPDDCWSQDQSLRAEGKPRKPLAEQAQIRAEGRMLLEAGLTPKDITKKLDVSLTTVRNWRRRMRKEEAYA